MAGTLGRVEEFDGDRDYWPQYVERLEHFFCRKLYRGCREVESGPSVSYRCDYVQNTVEFSVSYEARREDVRPVGGSADQAL